MGERLTKTLFYHAAQTWHEKDGPSENEGNDRVRN